MHTTINSIIIELQDVLWNFRARILDISGREKSSRAILSKLNIGEPVFDVLGCRILVSSREDCYKVFKYLQKRYEIIPQFIKDYIKQPKRNGYQSLHATMSIPDIGLVEVQIRTKEMHNTAEIGSASHQIYKREKYGI